MAVWNANILCAVLRQSNSPIPLAGNRLNGDQASASLGAPNAVRFDTMRRKIYSYTNDFRLACVVNYHAPETLDDALSVLAGGEVTIVGGGTDFFPSLIPGRSPRSLLDVTGIACLESISQSDAGWRIGAATTWSEIIDHPLPPVFDGLKAAARTVGSVQIQNAATIAGNICNASPAADGVPPLLALDATVELTSRTGARRVRLEDFIAGVRSVDLRPGELMTAVLIPNSPRCAGSSFVKLGSRKYLVISIAMVSAVVWPQDGLVQEARVAVGSCSPVAKRLRGLESALRGLELDTAAEIAVNKEHLAPLSPIDDVRGSAEYRMEAVCELCRRAVAAAIFDG